MQKVMGANWQFFLQHNTGHLVNIINNESQHTVVAIKYFCRYISDFVAAVVLLAISLYTSFAIVSIGIIFGYIFVLAIRRFISLTQIVRKLLVDTNNQLNSVAIENFTGSKLIKGMALNPVRIKLFSRLLDTSAILKMKLEIYKSVIKSYQEPAAVLILSLVIYYISSHSSIYIGDGLVALLLLHRTYAKIMAIQASKRNVVEGIPSVEICLKYLRRSSGAVERSGTKTFKEIGSAIELEGINFYYDEKTHVLKDLDCSIPNKSVVAFVGQSGSGKTTLTNLILGFLNQQSGKLAIDGTDLEEYDVVSWRERIGYVPQETVLFNGTITENIKLAKTDATEDDIVYAAKLAHAHEFIMEQTEGYKTQVGDMGIRLSGGQKQRLALARALLRKPQVLILDEATSALDNESERKIQQTLQEIKGDMTIIIIAHRLSTLEIADTIFVLQEGRIEEQGSFESLVNQDGVFNKLYNMQSQ